MIWLYWLSFFVCILTALAFVGAMVFFFAPAHERSNRRRFMIASIYICTLFQFVALASSSEIDPYYSIGGLILFAFAHLLFWTSLVIHRYHPPSIAFSKALPCILIVIGPYRFIRHPFYTSYLIAWLAGACVTANYLLIFTAVWMFGFYYLAAVEEESQMIASEWFGAKYRLYQQKTGMFLPRLFR